VRYALDTTALSAAMRHEEAMLSFLRALRPGDVATVPPAVAEIEYGIRRLEPGSRKRTLLEDEQRRLLRVITVLDWTPEASRLFGTMKSTLERSGGMIDDIDVAIAAIAVAHDASVVTANLVHFTRIENLRVRHWRG
jgi:tRNA(fMet)-specific endonuclease VapC